MLNFLYRHVEFSAAILYDFRIVKYIEREISPKLLEMTSEFPVLLLSGPLQSGKTTVLKNLFSKKYKYLNLDEKEMLDFALNDPKGFLNTFTGRVIIDEVQKAPALLLHIKTKVEEKKLPGSFILSTSANTTGIKSFSRSLEGRIGMLTLLPFSLSELEKAGSSLKTVNDWMLTGCFPRLVSAGIEKSDFYNAYIEACLKQCIFAGNKFHDPEKLKSFLGAAAARAGNPVNLSGLSAEVSADTRTINAWISMLKDNFILFRFNPYISNLEKRNAKTPKLYFYDSGLLCFLLGLKREGELNLHRIKECIFENAVITEVIKRHYNTGRQPKLFYWRDLDAKEREISLIGESPRGLELAEIKLSQTINKEYTKNLLSFKSSQIVKAKCVIFDGSEKASISGIRYISWKELGLPYSNKSHNYT